MAEGTDRKRNESEGYVSKLLKTVTKSEGFEEHEERSIALLH
jgi:hypothetical protein